MFSILDGREHFYQWDLDRKLVVDDDSITEVHFCNKTDECSLVCEVYNYDTDLGAIRVVNVPNVILTSNYRIFVYAYDENYTKHCARFEVKARTKPADYVYTETEVKSYSALLERMDSIEDTISELKGNTEVDLTGYATEIYVDEAIEALVIPDVSNFTTMAAVEAKGYQTATQVQTAIDNALSAIGVAEEGAY